VELKIHAFLTSTLNWGKCSSSLKATLLRTDYTNSGWSTDLFSVWW